MGSANGENDSRAAPAMATTATIPEPPRAPVNDDLENPASAPEVSSVVRRWRVAGLMEKGSLALRALACLFSALAFVVMVSNRHGDWREFDKYEEYRYLVAISILVFLYSAAQLARRVLPASGTAKDMWSKDTAAKVDFVGDQVSAYLMLSAMSAAVPMTNRMREGTDNIFTDASAAAIAMAFFGFACLAVSATVSGYKLAKQSYI